MALVINNRVRETTSTEGNSDSSTLTRTTVLESSNSDAAVDFAAGSKEVFCTLPSEKAVYLDADGDPVGVSGGQITDQTKTFSNYAILTANRSITLVTGTNYMLVGPIDVDTYVWDVGGDGALTII
jgi:hypothetical protein